MPPVVDHVTELLLSPETDALNCWVAPVSNDAEVGFTETLALLGLVTVTVAAADLVESATLVALTV